MDLLDLPANVLRFLWWLIQDCFFSLACWCVGWLVCRTLTLNRYPKERFTEFNDQHLTVNLVGLVTLIAVFVLVILVVS